MSGRRRREFVDGINVDGAGTDPDERAADRFARDVLLPPDEYARFVEAGDIGRTAVRAFADTQGVAPGIVAGRLERDKRVRPGQLHSLKKTLRFPSDRP